MLDCESQIVYVRPKDEVDSLPYIRESWIPIQRPFSRPTPKPDCELLAYGFGYHGRYARAWYLFHGHDVPDIFFPDHGIDPHSIMRGEPTSPAKYSHPSREVRKREFERHRAYRYYHPNIDRPKRFSKIKQLCMRYF